MGPLRGIKVLELAGIGPAPFCAMLLADLGAEVIRIDRPGGSSFLGLDRVMCRSRQSLGLDLKQPEAVTILLDLVAGSDVLIEGMRPGVAERLGLGPGVCMERNERLVYGRMTGWGQDGPLRHRAGHDINYIALSGVLDTIGNVGGKPVLPLNLVADFGGGALYLAMGILAAIVERAISGRGQVVDAAMVDGAASLMTMFYEFRPMGMWEGERGTNLLDGGVPFYDTYETADGRYMAVGPLEPQFYAEFLDLLGLDGVNPATQYDPSSWPDLAEQFAAVFLTESREHWAEVFSDSDACTWPVLSLDEAPHHPHNMERNAFTSIDGVVQPAPAPRFSRSVPTSPASPPHPGADTNLILGQLGIGAADIADLRSAGVVF